LLKEKGEEGKENMKPITLKALCLTLVTLISLSTLSVLPVLSHDFPTRFKAGIGKGEATFYVTPEDNNFTSSKPSNLKAGTPFTINIRIANATFIASWQVELTYNKNYLETTPGNISYASDHIFPTGTYSPQLAAIDTFNGTHNYALLMAATYYAVEYNATDAGLMTITFYIIADPDPGQVLWCMLRMMHAADPPPHTAMTTGTWTMDTTAQNENDLYMRDGYYENRYVPPPPPYLELLPVSITKPDVAGDRIPGTPRAKFGWELYIRDMATLYDVILVQWSITYNATLLDVYEVLEGLFMNDTSWAPYGTQLGWAKDPGAMYGFILINTNPETGEWNWTERPEGEGLLATIGFEAIYQPPDPVSASCAVDLKGVFGEFFLNSTEQWQPYSEPGDARYTINGYYWANPVAAFTWSPPTPLVGTPVLFDASASRGFRNVGGVLVPDLTYIKEFTWNFGDGNITTVTVPTIIHAYADMGEYPVTLTVKDFDNRIDTESKLISIVFGRLIDVFTQYEDPFGGKGINMTSDMFWPQKPVILTAILTYNGDAVQHKPVAFQIVSPTGYWNFTRVEFTDANGIAIITFGLPWPCDYAENLTFGVWTVIAKADIQCVTCEDWLWFKVYWYTHELTVTPKASSYTKCQTAEFNITFKSYSRIARWVLVTMTVYDDLNVPIGQASAWILVGNRDLQWDPTCRTYLTYNLTLSAHIPKWAYVGKGKVFVNTFFDWPMECGYPLSPEARAEFRILKA